MAGSRSLGQLAFRAYTAVYVAVVGVGLLADASHVTSVKAPTPRVTAVAGLALLGLVAVAGWAGRAVVALRPTAAEVQLSLLSSAPRSVTLRRTMRVSLALSAAATVVLAMALMVLSPATFAGLDVFDKLAVVAFAAGVGALAFGVHLLVAERRGTPLTLAGVAVAVTLATDAVRDAGHSVVTESLRGLVTRSPLPALLSVALPAGAIGTLAWRQSERLSLERIARGADASDGASLAVAGNDVRSLMLALRAPSSRPWRARPAFTLPSALALRFPITARAFRSLARWRLARVISVGALVALASALLTSGAPSTQRTALAALVLWGVGLSLNEPLAQEHDRRDRLELLPNARSIELRLLGASACMTFVVMIVALAARLPFGGAVALAAAAASASTVSAAMSLRATWRLLLDPSALGLPPEVIGGRMLYKLARPALVGFLCLSPWGAGVSGPAVAIPALAIGAVLVATVSTNNFANLRLRTGLVSQ